MDSILLGVVSGVITAMAIALSALFVKRIAIPWYQSLTYDGIDLSGEWHCIAPWMSQEIQLTISQRAKTLSGTATFIDAEVAPEKATKEYEIARTFTFTGFVQDRFVVLTLRHTSKNRLGICCYLLEVVGDGRKMSGVFSFFSVGTTEISYSHHTLFRDRSLACQFAARAKEAGALSSQPDLFEPRQAVRRLNKSRSSLPSAAPQDMQPPEGQI